MLHELYEDMDPDYRSREFLSNKKLISRLNDTQMKNAGLHAGEILSANQLGKVQQIRLRRLANALGGFISE